MKNLLVLNAVNGWEWGLLGLLLMVYYGSVPHSVRLAPVRKWMRINEHDGLSSVRPDGPKKNTCFGVVPIWKAGGLP